MKLLILSESPLDKIGNDYYAVDPWIRIAIQLAEKCERVTLWAPVAVREKDYSPSPQSWKVQLGKLKIEHHDYYYRFVQYYKLLPFKFLSWIKKADRLIPEHDIVILRAPSPMGSLLARRTLKKNRPLVSMILLNITTQSDRFIQSRGLKRFLYSRIIQRMIRQEIWICKRSSLLYVYSQELVDRHLPFNQQLKMMQDPHLKLSDFSHREDTCQAPEIRLLRLCWLIPSKGVESLLESLALLKKRGLPVKLEIVGQERTTGYQKTLEEYAEKLGVRKEVTFSGWLPFDRITEAYDRSDIQVLSSLGEGTPRCIVEGFSRGLPLVCTDVGGCHDTLTNEKNALLVPPQDPVAMANAIERVIQDGELRRLLIREGYKSAKQTTFEVAGDQFVNDLTTLTLSR